MADLRDNTGVTSVDTLSKTKTCSGIKGVCVVRMSGDVVFIEPVEQDAGGDDVDYRILVDDDNIYTSGGPGGTGGSTNTLPSEDDDTVIWMHGVAS